MEQTPHAARALDNIELEHLYTLKQLAILFKEISKSGGMYRLPRNERTIRRLLSTEREPGKIWARNMGNPEGRGSLWMIPGLSILEFFRGDARAGCCPTCGKDYNKFDLLDNYFTKDEVREWIRQRR